MLTTKEMAARDYLAAANAYDDAFNAHKPRVEVERLRERMIAAGRASDTAHGVADRAEAWQARRNGR